MADRVLFISWGETVRGREERALESFNEAIGLYGRLQQDGRIESFEVVLLDAHGDLGGYFELRGSSEQLAALREDDEFRQVILDASLIVDGMRVVDGRTGAAIAHDVEMFQQAIAKVPQAS
jgi:hypothetical protein